MRHGATGRRGDLPEELTSFVGRETEVTTVRQLLARSRLVTLTGTGGVGKTRIALRVAAELRRRFADGTYVVELSALQDAELLTHTVAAALGLPEQTAFPPLGMLVEYLKDKELLLILDTCEHIIGDCATLADALRSGAPNLHILATSRQPLDAAGEHTLAIAPLPIPGSDDEPFGETYDALVLFAERAAAVVPGFEVTEANQAAVTSLCRRLDGIPLAIELAVVLLRALALEQMVELLNDRFQLLSGGLRTALPRHQTLRTAIGWSHELCTPEERLLWARLSVFAGDFDLTAVQRVCARTDLSPDTVLQHLISLVNKSIVIRVEGAAEDGSGPRYRMLDTIREYGQEWLASLDEQYEIRQRHRDYYAAMATQFDTEWSGSGQVAWCRRLSRERPNIRVALEFCYTEDGEAETGLRIATRLWGYWLCSARLSEGRYWLDRGLELVPGAVPLRARALWLTGWYRLIQGEHAASEPLLEEARSIAERIGDNAALAYAIQYLGNVHTFQGDIERGLVLYEDAVARLRARGDRVGLVIILFQLGFFYVIAGNVTRGRALCDESLQLNGENDERWSRAYALYAKGLGSWVLGEYDECAELVSASLRMKHELGDIQGIAHCLEVLSWVAAEHGRFRRTAWIMGVAHELWAKIGVPLFGMEVLRDYHDTAAQRAREAIGGAGYDELFRSGTALTLDQAVDRATGHDPEETPAAGGDRRGTALATFTTREREVAALIANGLTTEEIAERLVISRRTAGAYVEHVLGRLGSTP